MSHAGTVYDAFSYRRSYLATGEEGTGKLEYSGNNHGLFNG